MKVTDEMVRRARDVYWSDDNDPETAEPMRAALEAALAVEDARPQAVEEVGPVGWYDPSDEGDVDGFLRIRISGPDGNDQHPLYSADQLAAERERAEAAEAELARLREEVREVLEPFGFGPGWVHLSQSACDAASTLLARLTEGAK